jgi:hypothetical protein
MLYCGATLVLDQIYFDPLENIFGLPSQPASNPQTRRAQTFTVAIGGLLNRVDNRIVFSPGSQGVMRTLATVNGVPTLFRIGFD